MGGSKRQSAPVLRRAKPKIKKAPSGRQFEKGNEHGLAHRFKKGQSGNPGGRPKSAEIGTALRQALKSEEAPPRRTYAEKLAARWITKSLAGNVGALASLANRAEGMPPQSMSVEQGGGKIDLILEAMATYSTTLGPPEGMEESDAEARLALETGGEPTTEEVTQ